LSRRLKQHSPGVLVVGVDPVGSILALPEQLNVDAGAQYAVEGIGCASLQPVPELTRQTTSSQACSIVTRSTCGSRVAISRRSR